MRREFGRDYIEDEFARIGNVLDQSLTVYLIGGGALAFRDLKDATKDIDVVVEDSSDLSQLREALTQLDYDPVRDPEEEYEDLGATVILENDDGCRFDIFNRQVADKLIFSQGMQDRSEPLETRSELTVRTTALEDIFLFKSVAGRAGDIEDMNTLVQAGVDFETVLEELKHQTELLGEELFVTHVEETLIDLEDRFGVTTPLAEDIEELSRRVYDQLAVIHSFEDTTTVEEIRNRTELSENRISHLLNQLEAKGSIRRDGTRVEKIENRV